ncbi:MAG: VOC family protein, partial [Deltaproteobacteria bacterium]|nr:VOC family protein [Deltaproteobacteria bacterium]
MRMLHTMIRVNDLDESLNFYCDLLGMKLLRKKDYDSGRFTLAFVGYGSEAENAVIELTYNWDTHKYDLGNAFGHIAIGVDDIYKSCEVLR